MRRLNYSHEDENRLRRSVQTFGFGSLPNAIMQPALKALHREAQERLGLAGVAEQAGVIRYRANIAPLGTEASALLSSDETNELLFRVFRQPVALSAELSCLTIYGEGDYLGPHMDQPATECAVTLIVYISASSTLPISHGTGLMLKVYQDEPAAGTEPCLSIPTRSGSIVIGHGSSVWHERPPLLPGERVVALTSCFARAGS